MKRVVQELALRPVLLTELLLSSAVISLLGLATSIYSIMILSRYVGLGIDTTLYTLTTGVLLALLFEHLLRSARFNLLEGVQKHLDQEDSAKILAGYGLSRFESLESLSDSEKREILSAPTHLNQAFSPANLSAVFDTPFALMYLLILTIACPIIGVLTTLCVVVSVLVSLYGIRILKEPAEEMAKHSAKAGIFGHYLASAGESLRSFICLPILRNYWNSTQGLASEQRRILLKRQAFLVQSGTAIASLLSVMTYATGAIQVVQGSLGLGTLIGLNILSARCFATFNRITSMLEPLARAKRASEMLLRLQKLEMEPIQGIVPQDYKGGLELISVAIRFPAHPIPVLENLHLKIPAGSLVGIQGPNGSGKTSLMRLLTGLRAPSEGLIKIDGMELRQIFPEWWRNKIAYLPQDLHFFDGTLKENLTSRYPQITDDSLLSLCKACDLMGFLTSRPEGLEIPIRNQAQDLPAGVRRRIALARALAGPSSLVLFDEPTEGLDPNGIQALLQILKTLASEKRTIIMATNEAQLLNLCDWLLVLDQGPGHKILKREAP